MASRTPKHMPRWVARRIRILCNIKYTTCASQRSGGGSVAMHRKETWLALIVVGVGLIPAAILGLWGYMSITATPLHPGPQDVPSVTRSVPLPQWVDAAE